MYISMIILTNTSKDKIFVYINYQLNLPVLKYDPRARSAHCARAPHTARTVRGARAQMPTQLGCPCSKKLLNQFVFGCLVFSWFLGWSPRSLRPF